MKKCIKCDMLINDDAEFCSYCGERQIKESKRDVQLAEYSRIIGVVSLCLCGTGILLGLSLGLLAIRFGKRGMKTSKKDIAHQGYVLGWISVIISLLITTAVVILIILFLNNEAVKELIELYLSL